MSVVLRDGHTSLRLNGPRTVLGVRRFALVLALAFAGGCAENDGAPPAPPRPDAQATAPSACTCDPAADGPVVDPVLLAFLSKARAAHHEADLVQEKEPARAIASLQKLVDGPLPTPRGAATAPEVLEVLADTQARMAELKSSGGDFDGASRHVEDGLRLATAPTHFRGHLVEVRGLVEERRSKALKEKGDLAGAEKAKQEAIRSFTEAIEIQDQVIERALGDAGP